VLADGHAAALLGGEERMGEKEGERGQSRKIRGGLD
jgi:hypothetical protein